MRVPIFRAKDNDSDEYVEGFYVEYPPVNVPEADVSVSSMARCIFVCKPGMMGIINDPYVCSIDIGTLEFVRYIDIPCKNGQIVL